MYLIDATTFKECRVAPQINATLGLPVTLIALANNTCSSSLQNQVSWRI